MVKILFSVLALLFLSPDFVLGDIVAEGYVDVMTSCPITPQIWEIEQKPEASGVYKGNNLYRKTGSALFAIGEKIKIEGVLVDSNCVPIDGAVVTIWQRNAKGAYQFDGYNKEDDKYSDQKNKDSNFTGSGMSITDNLGRYAFWTIVPKVEASRAPYINFSIYHVDFLDFRTQMFFPDHGDYNKDSVLTKYTNTRDRNLLVAKKIESKDRKQEKELEGIYQFNITLEGQIKYKNY